MNKWLHSEEKKILKDQKKKKKHHLKETTFEEIEKIMKLSVMLALICMGLLMSKASAQQTTCPYCEMPISIDVKSAGIWGNTWECPRCGYENYDQINNCGQCGRGKP